MKLIHFADLHIGSKFDRMPENIKAELLTKLRNAFSKILSYAKENSIDTILMSGDIFDRNAVIMSDKKFFYDSMKESPEIDFYYIKGNHDSSSKYSESIPNLHLFSGVQSYLKGEVRIIGYELSEDNSALYEHSPFSKDRYNVMMLHGDIHNVRDEDYIDLKRLQGKNVDYFALGHIHKREDGWLSEARYAYPGCVLGRGFDETGEKGFLVLDTEDSSISFHALTDVEFERIEVDMKGKNEASLKSEVSSKLGDPNGRKITEIKLTGQADFLPDLEDLGRTFEGRRHYLSFKNASKMALSYKPSENENSLRSMFINKVLGDPSLDEDTKQKVIEYGLSKLMKEEI